MARSLAPTSSIWWASPRARVALKDDWPALFSSTQSRANLPCWMSANTRFISALVSRGDDARAGDIFAILRGVGDGVVHVGDAAFIDQVDDQLHFVQAFEIGHFRGITGFDQGFEAAADQLDQAAAQHDLLAEQVGFAFFLEVGLDDAGAAAADGGGIGQAQVMGVAAGILMDGDQDGTPPPLRYSPRTVWPGPLGATISTSRSGRGSISLKCTLKPWANSSAAPCFMLFFRSSL